MKSSNMEHTQGGRTLNFIGLSFALKYTYTLPFDIITSLSLVQHAMKQNNKETKKK